MFNRLLESQYKTRSWVKVHEADMNDPSSFDSGIKSSPVDARIRVFTSGSPFAARVEESISSGVHDTCDYFIFDLELLAADYENLNAGGSISVLAEDWKGFPAGTMLMTVYRGMGLVVFAKTE